MNGEKECDPCTYLPAEEEDSSPTSYLDTDQLSLWSGNDTHVNHSESGPLKGGSRICECGKGMSECSTHPNTVEEWTLSMRDSLVRTLAWLESKPALGKGLGQDFTEKCCVSVARFDPDTSSLRMCQQSLLMDSEPFSGILPRWGILQDGVVYEHPMSERRITGIVGGYSLPTPTAAMEAPNKNANTKGPKNLVEVALGQWDHILFATPCATESPASPAEKGKWEGAYWRRPDGSKRQTNLSDQVRMWPTPLAADAKMGANFDPDKTYRGLTTEVLFPTPRASEIPNSKNHIEERTQPGRKGPSSLTSYVEWKMPDTNGGKLNPEWVEWLMGWPIGFTASKHWETVRSRSKQQSHGESSEESDD